MNYIIGGILILVVLIPLIVGLLEDEFVEKK